MRHSEYMGGANFKKEHGLCGAIQQWGLLEGLE